MNKERSHEKNEALPKQKNDLKQNTQDLQSIPITERNSVNRQITPFYRDFEFRLRQSNWFHFSCGIFWGSIFSFTALFSASCGIALTRIEWIEQAISQTLYTKSSTPQKTKQHLTRSIDLLLLEVAPDKKSKTEFAQDFIGESKTILLVEFEPQSKTVKVTNIPPNSRVKIPEFGWGTIADAHRYGGMVLVSQMVAQLMDDVTIDRHVRATQSTFEQLIASGKINVDNCYLNPKQCSNPIGQISRQKTTVETIRQRLNIPSYLQSFKTTLNETQPDLDTNLSLPEAISLATFLKEIEPDNITVNLVSGYVAGKTINMSDRLSKSHSISTLESGNYSSNNFSFKDRPIAVQNTTDSPELGMRFVSYLRRQNFQDVYLVEHIPLRLNKTRITIDRSQLARAKYIKSIIGLGSLEANSQSQIGREPLTIQIGEDAHFLPLDNNN